MHGDDYSFKCGSLSHIHMAMPASLYNIITRRSILYITFINYWQRMIHSFVNEDADNCSLAFQFYQVVSVSHSVYEFFASYQWRNGQFDLRTYLSSGYPGSPTAWSENVRRLCRQWANRGPTQSSGSPAKHETLIWCWPRVGDDGPAFNHWFSVSC